MLHGVTSFHELATPIIGRLRSSSFIPMARNIDRCGARSGPSVTAQLLCLSLRSAITIKSPYMKSPQDNTAGRPPLGRQNFPGLADAWSRMRDRTRRQPTTYAAFMAINAVAVRNLHTCLRGLPQLEVVCVLLVKEQPLVLVASH